MSETIKLSGDSQANDGFQSLEKVKFAGDEPASQEAISTKEYEGLTLDEKVKQLRAPFESDEAIKISNRDTIEQMQGIIQDGNRDLTSLSESLASLRANLSELSQKSAQKSRGVSARLKSFFKLKDKSLSDLDSERHDVEKEIATATERIDEINTSVSAAERSIKETESKPDYETEPTPLSVEEKESLLSFDALSELSLDEYAALWRRLNPFYAAHVTRQGIRDHTGMVYHTGGKGEFHEGFTDTLNTGKCLVSPAEIQCGIKEVRYLSDKYKDTLGNLASKKMLDAAGVKYTRLVPTLESITLDFIPEEFK